MLESRSAPAIASKAVMPEPLSEMPGPYSLLPSRDDGDRGLRGKHCVEMRAERKVWCVGVSARPNAEDVS